MYSAWVISPIEYFQSKKKFEKKKNVKGASQRSQFKLISTINTFNQFFVFHNEITISQYN